MAEIGAPERRRVLVPIDVPEDAPNTTPVPMPEKVKEKEPEKVDHFPTKEQRAAAREESVRRSAPQPF